ncbi:hypothetical protein [Bosea sp. (in: a-proteobacteria)]|uniref:hypothetical protein n=1 Tax=Bosea sp. (in: a-proteobacteria) TaxID=1871050 RepID=UPI003B3AE742
MKDRELLEPTSPTVAVPAAITRAYLHYAPKKPELCRVDFLPMASKAERGCGWVTVALSPAPSASPVAAPVVLSEPDGLEEDVRAALQLLEDGEWAEHFATTDLGKALEGAITELHSGLNADLFATRADNAKTSLRARALELHEKGFMPWREAEELALREAGIGDSAIDELIYECSDSGCSPILCSKDELRKFTRAVLVHQPAGGSAAIAKACVSAA